MTWRETAHAFGCQGEQLVGVLCHPHTAVHRVGVVIVVGGPQYRVGSHRMFVRLARALATAGYSTLRFDVRGMGDSGGQQRSFESISEDVGAALDLLLQLRPELNGVVLWGLCDGASASLLYLDESDDARVLGLCLVNPWVRSAVSEARAQVKHYYRDRLKSRDFWVKLLSGRVGASAARGLWSSLRRAGGGRGSVEAAGFQQRMLRAWQRYRLPALVVLSGQDYTAREFEEYVTLHKHWGERLAAPEVRRLALDGTDHTFSSEDAMRTLMNATIGWLDYAMRVAAHA